MAVFVYCSRCLHTLTAHGGQGHDCPAPCTCPYWRAYDPPVHEAARSFKANRMRRTIRICIDKRLHERTGMQARLAEHFGVTRQRICQIVHQELDSRITN